jgi:hypothetical protein
MLPARLAFIWYDLSGWCADRLDAARNLLDDVGDRLYWWATDLSDWCADRLDAARNVLEDVGDHLYWLATDLSHWARKQAPGVAFELLWLAGCVLAGFTFSDTGLGRYVIAAVLWGLTMPIRVRAVELFVTMDRDYRNTRQLTWRQNARRFVIPNARAWWKKYWLAGLGLMLAACLLMPVMVIIEIMGQHHGRTKALKQAYRPHLHSVP